MSPEERITALAPFGFSKRQARFLDLVMRHSGVCVQRQYATFAGIVHGQKTRAFFAKLVRRGYASAFECRHNRGRIYHVHHSALYAAIDASNSRYRRPVSASRTTQRLMVLDAVIAGGDIVWLASKVELRRHFTSLVSPAAEPREHTERHSSLVDGLHADSMRVGIDPTGRFVLLYLAVPGSREDFRGFLDRCASVLSKVPAWTLRLMGPRSMTPAYESYQRVVRDEWETPLQPQIFDELIWYFERRRSMPPDRYPYPTDARWERAASTFCGPRFDRVYRRWRHGDAAALCDARSHTISSALANGSGQVEYLTLHHGYDHLSPVIVPRRHIAAPAQSNAVSLRAPVLPASEPVIQA